MTRDEIDASNKIEAAFAALDKAYPSGWGFGNDGPPPFFPPAPPSSGSSTTTKLALGAIGFAFFILFLVLIRRKKK